MHHFPKGERLKSRKKILALLNGGNVTKAGPIKIIWSTEPDAINGENKEAIQTAFSVPKRKFKKAVKRNRIRRKMKEIFRLNKQPLTEHLYRHQFKLNLLVIYLSGKDMPYKQIEKHLLKALDTILENLKYENINKYK